MDNVKIVDVLAAIREVIASQSSNQSHEPTPTEYFVAVVTAIKSTSELDHIDELLMILEAVTPSTHNSIVISQFSSVGDILGMIFTKCNDTKTQSRVLSVLGAMMKKHDTSENVWRSSSVLKLLNLFLMHIDSQVTRIRKVACSQLCDLLQIHKQSKTVAARSYVADFCTAVLQGCQRSNYKRSVCIVNFLSTALSYLEPPAVTALTALSLRIQECEQPVLVAAIYRMFDSFFQSPLISSGAGLSSRQLNDITHLLMRTPPRGLDMEAIAFYCTSLASAACALHRSDRALLYARAPGREYTVVQVGMVLVSRCESEFSQIHCAVGTALKRLIGTCVDDRAVAEALQIAEATSAASAVDSSCVGQLVTVIQSLLHLRNQPAWVFVMDAVRSLLECIPGRAGAVLLRGVVERLADIYHAISTGVMVAPSAGVDICVRDALGAALRCLTVEHFLAIVPLRLSTSPQVDPTSDLDTSRDWVLSILHANLKLMPCRLGDFQAIVLRDAKIFNAAVLSESRRATLKSSQLSILHTRVVQLWSLLPSFCASTTGSTPTDLAEAFPPLISTLDGAMKDSTYPELMIPILSALSTITLNLRDKYPTLCARGRNDHNQAITLPAELDVMRNQGAKVFIPSLLALLDHFDVSDVAHFQAIVRCVAGWAGIAPASLVTTVSKKLLQLLLASSQTEAVTATTSTAAASWMAVLLALIPFQSDQMATLLYRTIKPLLSVHEAVSMQKRAYKVLYSLLTHHAECLFQSEPRSRILSLIADSLLTCHVSARHVRLQCISSLVMGMAENSAETPGGDGDMATAITDVEGTKSELSAACNSIFCETLICLKDANKKSRDAALELIKSIYSVLEPVDVLPQLFAGIVGETATMRSAAIIGLCVLVHQYQVRSRGDDDENYNREQHEHLLDCLARLIPTVVLLAEEGSVEQTRAVLSFCRVCTGALSTPVLVDVLPVMFGGLLGTGEENVIKDRMKAKFSSRIRAIVRKVVQRLPVEVVREHIPESDVALLEYIQRQSRRTASRRKVKQHDRLEKVIGSDSEGDSDSSDDEDEGNSRHKSASLSRPKATRATDVIAEGLPTSLDDLLGDSQISRFGGAAPAPGTRGGRARSNATSEAVEENDEPFAVQISSDGRVLVVPVTPTQVNGKKKSRDDMEIVGVGEHPAETTNDKSGSTESAAQKRRREPGAEYRSAKAGGDVWKKGMLEPHAYIPLDARMLSKKNSKLAVSQVGATTSNKKRRTAGGVATAGQQKGVMTMLGRKQRIAMAKSKK